jgi:hypothetical protein
MKRKLKITLEMEELVLYKTRKSLTGFCPHCNAPVEIQMTENTETISNSGETEKFRLNEDAEIHSIEAERVFVCQNSLKNWADILINKQINIQNK